MPKISQLPAQSPATVTALRSVLNGTRTSAYTLSMGGTNTSNSQSSINQRYFVVPTSSMVRWRIKLANYDVKNAVAGTAMTGKAIYFGEGTLDAGGVDTGNFAAAPSALVSSDFTIPGDGSYYVSPWFTSPMAAGKHYVVSVGFSSGSAVPVFRGYNTSAIGFGGTAGALHAGDQSPGLTKFIFSFLDAVIEYDYSSAQGVTGLFIGDSLTECFGGDATAGMLCHKAWPQVVAARLGGSAVVNAIAGSVSGDWVSGTGNKWARIDTATYAPDYAVVALGSNDAVASVALATYQANIQTIVGTLRGYGIKRIYLATVMPRGLTGTPETSRTSYNGWLRAEPCGALSVFDFDRVVRDPAALTALHADYAYTDNVHLSLAGYSAVAQATHTLEKAPG